MKKTTHTTNILFSICLGIALTACSNDYNARAGAGFQKSNAAKSNASGRSTTAKRSGSFFQGGGISPDGGRQRTTTSPVITEEGAPSTPFDPTSLVLDPEVLKKLEEVQAEIAENADSAETNQENLNKAEIESLSKLDIATMVPAELLNTLQDHLRGKETIVDDNVALTIDDVDTVLGSVNAYLQNLALVDLTDADTKDAATLKVGKLKNLFESMANNATGIEENKVVAKLQKQQATLTGVETMLNQGASGTQIRDWVMANNQAGSQNTAPLPTNVGETVVNNDVPEQTYEAIALSDNMNIIYCFLKSLQDGHDESAVADCANQNHTDAELAVAMKQLMADLENGEEYAPQAAGAILALNDKPEKFLQYLSADEQDLVNLMDDTITDYVNSFSDPQISGNNAGSESAANNQTKTEDKPLVLTNANPTAADIAVMDDLANLDDAVSSYIANQSKEDAPHEVNLKKQEYLGMLDGIDARCDRECSEGQKPVYDQNRDALERKIRFYDQPEAKVLTDQIAALDPKEIDSDIIASAHDQIRSLPNREQREYAAQALSDKIEEARAQNPDGIQESERQAIVADFDEPLAKDQSVEDYLEDQEDKINAEYGLSQDNPTDWKRIHDEMTPAEKADYQANHQKVEDAKADLYQAQMDAAVEDEYAQATFGDQAQRERANDDLQTKQAEIAAKAEQLNDDYLSDPSAKSHMLAQAQEPIAQQYQEIRDADDAKSNQSDALAQKDLRTGEEATTASNTTQPGLIEPAAMEQLSAYLDDLAVAQDPSWNGDQPLTEEEKRILAPYNTGDQELETLDDAKAVADALPTQAQKDAGTQPGVEAAQKAKAQTAELKAVVDGGSIDPAKSNEPIDPAVREALKPQAGEQSVETLGDAEQLIKARQEKEKQDATKDQMEAAVNAQEDIAADLNKHDQELPVRENRSEQKEYLEAVMAGKKPIKIIDRKVLEEPLDPEIKSALEEQNTSDQELETVGDAVELIREKQKAEKAAEKNKEEDPEAAKQAAKEVQELQASLDTVETLTPEEAAKETKQADILEAVVAGDLTSEDLTEEQKQEPLSPEIKEAMSQNTPEGMPLDTVGNAAKVIEKHQAVANGEEVYDEQPTSEVDKVLAKDLDALGVSLDETIEQAGKATAADAPTKEDLQKDVKKSVDAKFASDQLVLDARLRGDMEGLAVYEKIDLIIAQHLQGKRWNEVENAKPILQGILKSYAETLNPNVVFETSRYSYPGGASEVVELKLPSISQEAIQMLNDGVAPKVFSQKVQQDLAGTLEGTGIDYLVYSLKHQLADHVNDNFLKKEMPILLVKNSGMNNKNYEYLYLVAQYLDAAEHISLGSLPLTTPDALAFDISIAFSIEQVNENL